MTEHAVLVTRRAVIAAVAEWYEDNPSSVEGFLGRYLDDFEDALRLHCIAFNFEMARQGNSGRGTATP